MRSFIAVLILSLTISCKDRSEKTTPTMETISESVYASGVVKSKNQYQVFSTVPGLIQEILVKEGDVVKAGDAILKLRNDPSKLNLLNSKLAVDYADVKANGDKLKEARANEELAKSKMKNDSLLSERQRNLWAQGIGSKVELEQRELVYKSSITAYQASRIRHDDLRRQLEFASDQAKNNLRISTTLAGDYIIRSETNGKIYKILKEKGELVNTQSPVAIVGDADEFLIELKIDEYDISRIKTNQRVLFTMDSYKGKVFEAVVDNVEPLMNEQSRSFTVNANFISKPTMLYPNLSVEANIVIQVKERALTIPPDYLIGDSMVVMANQELRKVSVGLKDYQKVEIQSGLTAGDIIFKPNP